MKLELRPQSAEAGKARQWMLVDTDKNEIVLTVAARRPVGIDDLKMMMRGVLK